MELDLDLFGKVLTAAISAAAGVGGVVWGARATTKRERLRDEKVLISDRSYLSTLLTVSLERFADACHSVSSDNGCDEYGKPAGDGVDFHKATTTAPEFDAEQIKGNWRSLDEAVMDRVHLFSYRLDEIKGNVSAAGIFSDPPEFPEYFNSRRYWYAVVGLEAIELVDLVRNSAGLKPMSRSSGEWAREISLKKVSEELRSKVVG